MRQLESWRLEEVNRQFESDVLTELESLATEKEREEARERNAQRIAFREGMLLVCPSFRPACDT